MVEYTGLGLGWSWGDGHNRILGCWLEFYSRDKGMLLVAFLMALLVTCLMALCLLQSFHSLLL